jgi:MraZ protein
MTSFTGTDLYALDHKGRIAIPPWLRRGESAKRPLTRFYLNRGFEGCVAVYPPETWSLWMERLRRRRVKVPNLRAFQRAFMNDAREVTVDGQGRVTIPPALIRHAGLGKEAVLHGANDHIEIWNPERYRKALGAMIDPAGEYDRVGELLENEEA